MPREMRGTINGAINDYMGQVVGIMFNDRISEITQKPDAPFIAGAIFDGDFFVSKTKDAFTLIALGKDNGAIDAIKGIMREAERIDRFGFTASEYDRARATLLSRYENMYKERNNQEQVKELEKNPYVKKVSNKSITYAKEFKELYWIDYRNGIQPAQTNISGHYGRYGKPIHQNAY